MLFLGHEGWNGRDLGEAFEMDPPEAGVVSVASAILPLSHAWLFFF